MKTRGKGSGCLQFSEAEKSPCISFPISCPHEYKPPHAGGASEGASGRGGSRRVGPEPDGTPLECGSSFSALVDADRSSACGAWGARGAWVGPISGVFFLVRDAVSGSSGIVANFCSTCFRAGRRFGLLRISSMPDSLHSFTLLSSEKAVKAAGGAGGPGGRGGRGRG